MSFLAGGCVGLCGRHGVRSGGETWGHWGARDGCSKRLGNAGARNGGPSALAAAGALEIIIRSRLEAAGRSKWVQGWLFTEIRHSESRRRGRSVTTRSERYKLMRRLRRRLSWTNVEPMFTIGKPTFSGKTISNTPQTAPEDDAFSGKLSSNRCGRRQNLPLRLH